jgi:hypothetical protein
MKKATGSSVNSGRNDLLHFAQKCCEAAGEDLTSFFEAWGFFHPMNKAEIGDYGNYVISSTSTMIKDAKKKMAKYPKKAAVEFIEDRAAPSLRTDGGEGYKLDYVPGKCAEMGQYTAYTSDSIDITASGYIYTKSGNKFTFSGGKNAVGFKVYDTDGTLITFTNFHNIELSDEIVSNNNFVIVAVSANGTEVTVNDKRDGTEEQQLGALKDALASAEVILTYSDNTGKKVGYYYESALVNLTSIVNDVKAVIENNDQSVHTYGEWAKIIDNEIVYLNTADYTRIQIYSGNVYKLTNVNYSGYTMYYETSGYLTCKGGTANPKSRQFTFTSTGNKDEFYISVNGKYIDYVGRSRQAKATTTKKSEALKFTVGEHGIGKIYMYKAGDTDLGLHCDQYKNVVGWNHTETPTLWNLVCVTLNKENSDEKSLQSLISEAASIHDLIVDTLNTDATTFYDWVEVTSETLIADVDSMMALVVLSQDAIANKQYEKYPALIDNLTSIIATVQAGYTIPTGIDGIIFDEEDAVIYDSRGRRVNKITSSGIYIIDGKKMYISK